LALSTLPRALIVLSLLAAATLSGVSDCRDFPQNFISAVLRPKAHRHASYVGYLTIVDEVRMKTFSAQSQ
jgi:hypothetical protein